MITSVSGVGTGTVTLNAAAGQLSILSAGDITSGGTIELTGATGIVTAGDILTTGADVNFNSATTLSGNIESILAQAQERSTSILLSDQETLAP